MVLSGAVWFYLELYGFIWSCMVLSGAVWLIPSALPRRGCRSVSHYINPSFKVHFSLSITPTIFIWLYDGVFLSPE